MNIGTKCSPPICREVFNNNAADKYVVTPLPVACVVPGVQSFNVRPALLNNCLCDPVVESSIWTALIQMRGLNATVDSSGDWFSIYFTVAVHTVSFVYNMVTAESSIVASIALTCCFYENEVYVWKAGCKDSYFVSYQKELVQYFTVHSVRLVYSIPLGFINE